MAEFPLKNALIGLNFYQQATTFELGQVILEEIVPVGISRAKSGYTLTPDRERYDSKGVRYVTGWKLEINIDLIHPPPDALVEQLAHGPRANVIMLLTKAFSDYDEKQIDYTWLNNDDVAQVRISKPVRVYLEEKDQLTAGGKWSLVAKTKGQDKSSLVTTGMLNDQISKDILIDFSVSEPNQKLTQPGQVQLSQVEISQGSINYGAFSTSFDGVQFAESSGGWMATTDPLSAKKFFFGIQAVPGWEFRIMQLQSLVRSTAAGPTAMALVLNSQTILDQIDTPNSGSPVLSLQGDAPGWRTSAGVAISGFDGQTRNSTGGGAARIAAIAVNIEIRKKP